MVRSPTLRLQQGEAMHGRNRREEGVLTLTLTQSGDVIMCGKPGDPPPPLSLSERTRNHTDLIQTPTHTDRIQTPTDTDRIQTPNRTDRIKTPTHTDRIQAPNRTDRIQTRAQARTPDQSQVQLRVRVRVKAHARSPYQSQVQLVRGWTQ
jgi:hypothetical protein